MIYLKLLWNFIQIGLFTIGGGYAALPLIKHHIVDSNSYITLSEFMDIIAIAESTPGPIAINAATFVGVKTAGIFGGIICTLGIVLPSLVIVLILGIIYSKYKNISITKTILRVLRPVALGLISVAAVTIVLLAFFGGEKINIENFDYIILGIVSIGFIVLRKFKINPIWVMLGSGFAGMVLLVII